MRKIGSVSILVLALLLVVGASAMLAACAAIAGIDRFEKDPCALGCDGGDGGAGGDSGRDATMVDSANDGSDARAEGGPAVSYSVGGVVSGLTGTGLLLQDNGGAPLAVMTNGSFTFATKLPAGASYDVTVMTQPTSPPQSCTVAGGTGTIAAADVTSVMVTCTVSSFAVGGFVIGLEGSGMVLQDNGGDSLSIGAGDGGVQSFAFPTKVPSGSPFAVTILTQPTSPVQSCGVTGGTGTIATGDVTGVVVNCSTNTFTVGGTVTGLAGAGLILEDNGGNDLLVNSNGSFAFSLPLLSGAPYDVTVKTQPAGPPAQTCTVGAASGTIGQSNVTTVAVTCTTNSYTVGVTVSGLQGTGLVLQDNGGDNLAIGTNGSFVFATPLPSGMSYTVTVFAEPASPGQVCTVTGATGTISNANITSVAVSCVTLYTVGGTASGLTSTGLVLQDNGGDTLNVGANGPFTFPTALLNGVAYTVTVMSPPSGALCTLENATGTIANAPVTNVQVNCAYPFGDGSSGPLSVTGTSTIDPTASTANGTSGGTSVTLGNAAGFAAAQVVLFQQSQGAGAGQWELGTVASVNGAVLTLLSPLANSYLTDASGDAAQAIVVPEYTSVDVAAGGTLTAPPWNGSTGGILVLASSGATTIEGLATMSGEGFRGGNSGNCAVNCAFGVQGESQLGPGSNGGGMLGSAAALANNGAGGGGGAPGQDCGMGAAGAYGSAGDDGTNATFGTCSSTTTNSSGGAVDGLPNLTDSILFGGGGGEGGHDEDGSYPGVGGNGGGIIVIFASSLTVTGSVTANGVSGATGVNDDPCGGTGCGMGGGGGGAGGAIRLVAGTANVGASLVASTGGGGGGCSCAGPFGGTGGLGRIGIQSGSVSGTTNPPYDPD